MSDQHEAAESYCNHDTAAINDFGRCECGEEFCTCPDGLPAHDTPAICGNCGYPLHPRRARDIDAGIALDLIAAQIHGYLNDTGDSTDRLDSIAAILRGTRREVRSEAPEPDDITCGQADETREDD